ncbi:unnamed protein product [Parajaminaea phylloscopi]
MQPFSCTKVPFFQARPTGITETSRVAVQRNHTNKDDLRLSGRVLSAAAAASSSPRALEPPKNCTDETRRPEPTVIDRLDPT